MGDNFWISTGPYTGGPYIVEGEDDYNQIQILQRNQHSCIIRRYPTNSESHYGLDSDNSTVWGYYYFKLTNGEEPVQLTKRQAKLVLKRYLKRTLGRTPLERELVEYEIPERGRDIILPPRSYPLLRATSITPYEYEEESDYDELLPLRDQLDELDLQSDSE